MYDLNREEITKLVRLVQDLGERAANRGDTTNEAYFRGVAEGLGLAELIKHDQVEWMTRWSQILASQQDQT
ncbi:hypothetical protein [Microvirga sp. M2]|uniref:hypothetical protein n=1 Tax=Microvirga sp. M2 TaxID=3073270 RepID=UPI0039C23E97